MTTHIRSTYTLVSCALLFACLVKPGRAQTTYHVQVNTAPLSGQAGNLDLQFNPGGIDALNSTLTISNFFSAGGSLAGTSTNTGGATGTLPGPPSVTIDNSGSFNDLFQGITFGNGFSFDATFTGPALNPSAPFPTSGSVFALSLYDDAGVTPLLTTSSDGSLLHIDLNPDGSFAVTPFAASDGVFYASADLSTSAVPEASSYLLFAGGLFGMCGYAWRSRKGRRLLH